MFFGTGNRRGASRWSALDDGLARLRQCTTIDQLNQCAAEQAITACDAQVVVLGQVVGQDWLPWMQAGNHPLLESADIAPVAAMKISELPVVEQRAASDHTLGSRRLGTDQGLELVVTALVSGGATWGLIHVVGQALNHEIIKCYANALDAVVDLLRVRQRVERQQHVLARLRGALGEPSRWPIDLLGDPLRRPDVDSTALTRRQPPPAALRERLTDRQREVLSLMMAGLTNAQTAEQLVVALPTVKSHVRAVLRASGSVNRSEALARFRAPGRSPDQ